MPRLDVDDMVMEFPAVRALDGVSVTFEPGEVHGIIGENGAGKSTLMKIMSGLQQQTSGEIRLDGRRLALSGVRDAIEHGIAMIHQELNLVDELTAAENVFLGREVTRHGLLDRERMNADTARYLAEVRAPFPPTVRVGELSIAGKQLVEIAKALASDASVLIMDEPTAVLSDPESEALFALIRRLRERGVCVVYISHRLAEVVEICDRVTVLRDGRLVTTIERGEGFDLQNLADLMVGRPLSDMYPPKTEPPVGASVLEVQGATVTGLASNIDLAVRPGEVVGLSGLVGSGRTELAEALVGARALEAGEIRVDGRPARIRNPRDAVRYGIAYVSEDRKGIGLHLGLSVVSNLTMANLAAYCRPLLDHRREVESTRRWVDELDVRAGNIEAPILYLSGGNQQKIAIAKWLDTKPRVLILDEPTRGVDVGAKREVYQLIRRLVEEGMACIVISSELPEIIGLCHRTLVMREGRLVGELVGDEMTEEAIMRLAAGVTA